jgi:ABC-2 type transport system ATP-binding protein/lipopolysaccharide transport system ATP-binding protein
VTAPAIVVDHLSKRFRLPTERRNSLKERVLRGGGTYREFWALQDVSLEVQPATTFGLIGHNGSGKSTLLKVLAGILRPTSGAVTVDGRVSALLELGAGFHPELTGRDNILLNGSILGLSQKQILAAMDRIIEFSGIGEFIDAPVKVYSSGMYVRLGFSIAVNLDPEVLIIDEVIAVGDEEFQRKCFDHLYQLKRRGCTIVFVSHSMPLVTSLCDEAAWIDHGRVRHLGNPIEVADAYLSAVNALERQAAGTAEQDDGSKGRRGSGAVAVRGLEILGSDGQQTIVTTPHEAITLRIRLGASEMVTGVGLKLQLETEGGIVVGSPTQRFTEMVLEPGEEVVIDYAIPAVSLQPGTYAVSVTVADPSMAHVFDDRDRSFLLHVRGGGSSGEGGLVDLGGHWSGGSASRKGAGA